MTRVRVDFMRRHSSKGYSLEDFRLTVKDCLLMKVLLTQYETKAGSFADGKVSLIEAHIYGYDAHVPHTLIKKMT